MDGVPDRPSFPAPSGLLAAPHDAPLDEPPPAGVTAPQAAGRLANGFWPVPCPLVVDDGSARLRLPTAAGTTVHAVVAATVRAIVAASVELEADDGRRFRLSPVTAARVRPGDAVRAGALLGRVAGERAAVLELSIREPDGRWVDPYPLLVGLADPNELGVDAATGDGIDPDASDAMPAVTKTAAPPERAGSSAEPLPPPAPPTPAAAPAAPTQPDAPAAPPAAAAAPPPTPATKTVASDVLAAMVAPTPPPEHVDD